jgi:hypothetical protein
VHHLAILPSACGPPRNPRCHGETFTAGSIRAREALPDCADAICADYAAAMRALAYWEKDRSKAEDYRQPTA